MGGFPSGFPLNHPPKKKEEEQNPNLPLGWQRSSFSLSVSPEEQMARGLHLKLAAQHSKIGGLSFFC